MMKKKKKKEKNWSEIQAKEISNTSDSELYC